MLPAFLKKYFWDCNFSDLNLKQYKYFIAIRILNYGNEKSIKWLTSKIDKKTIIKAIKNREIDDKTKNYWELILDINK